MMLVPSSVRPNQGRLDGGSVHSGASCSVVLAEELVKLCFVSDLPECHGCAEVAIHPPHP